jgi:ribosome-associated translation inhibitor RaiA
LPMISARGLGVDCYRAFALAMEKATKQLRRMKREVRDNRARRPARAANMPSNARL